MMDGWSIIVKTPHRSHDFKPQLQEIDDIRVAEMAVPAQPAHLDARRAKAIAVGRGMLEEYRHTFRALAK